MTTQQHIDHCYKMIETLVHEFNKDVCMSFTGLSMSPEAIWEKWESSESNLLLFKSDLPDDILTAFNSWSVKILNELNVILKVETIVEIRRHELPPIRHIETNGITRKYIRGQAMLKTAEQLFSPSQPATAQQQHVKQQQQMVSQQQSFSFQRGSVMARRTGARG